MKVTQLCLFALGLSACLAMTSPYVYAEKNWLDTPVTAQHAQVSLPVASLYTDNCEYGSLPGAMGMLDSYCVIQDGDVSFGYNVLGQTVAKKRYDTKYFPLVSTDKYIRLSGNGMALGYRMTDDSKIVLSVYRDISRRLSFAGGQYVFSTQNPVFRTAPQDPWAIASSLSGDGRYITLMAVNPMDTEHTYVSKMSTATGHAMSVGTISVSELVRSGAPVISISDDGRYMAVVTNAIEDGRVQPYHTVKIWDTDRCGVTELGWCDSRTVSTGVSEDKLPKIGTPISLSFSEGSDQLVVGSVSDGQELFRTVYSIDELFGTSSVDYMALGDSYTSGEGAGIGGYLPGTDEVGSKLLGKPRERCHLSRLSYPLLLADNTLGGRDKTISVACSGAEISKDYIGKNALYMGQGSRLADIPVLVRANLKQNALDISHIPGRNKQVEFVKRYQPRVVTVMGGGNDVGFADVIRSCALPGTCEIVSKSDQKLRYAARVQSQHKAYIALYTALHKASPNTKIYAIGYPQFVSNKPDPCAIDQGLNFEERMFIRHGVSYLNEVIRTAAETVGVAYLDIEDSLEGRNLCSYGRVPLLGSVHGITPLIPWWGIDTNGWKEALMSSVDPGSYHPNTGGHAQIQRYITAQLSERSLIDVNYCRYAGEVLCPTRRPIDKVPFPAYFDLGYSSSVQSQSAKVLASQNVQKGIGDTLRVQVDGAAPGTTATIRMASTPITLGTVEVGEDGVIDRTYAIPAQAEAGYHTLYVDMQTPAGEATTLYETFLVLGATGDIDENGVADEGQACPFVAPGSRDEFGRSLDEYCLAASNLPEFVDDSVSSEPVPPAFPEHRSSISYSSTSSTSVLPALSPVALALGMKEMPGLPTATPESTISTAQHASHDQRTLDRGAHELHQDYPLRWGSIAYVIAGVVLCTLLTAVGIFYVKNKKTD